MIIIKKKIRCQYNFYCQSRNTSQSTDKKTQKGYKLNKRIKDQSKILIKLKYLNEEKPRKYKLDWFNKVFHIDENRDPHKIRES